MQELRARLAAVGTCCRVEVPSRAWAAAGPPALVCLLVCRQTCMAMLNTSSLL